MTSQALVLSLPKADFQAMGAMRMHSTLFGNSLLKLPHPIFGTLCQHLHSLLGHLGFESGPFILIILKKSPHYLNRSRAPPPLRSPPRHLLMGLVNSCNLLAQLPSGLHPFGTGTCMLAHMLKPWPAEAGLYWVPH